MAGRFFVEDDATKVVMLVATFLGLFAIIGLAGIIWLVAQYEIDAGTMAVIVSPTSAAIGALGGVLAGVNLRESSSLRPPEETSHERQP